MRKRNPPPTDPPEFFLDRSLGRRVGERLAAEGWTIRTMAQEFPRSESKRIEDVVWIPKVTQWGWVILAKDSFRKEHEQRMIRDCGARVFTLPNANMTMDAMVQRFVVSYDRIVARCKAGGPFHYSVSDDRMRPIKLPK